MSCYQDRPRINERILDVESPDAGRDLNSRPPRSPSSATDKAQRTSTPYLLIDPGFVNHRRIQAALGPRGIQLIDEAISRLPPELPDFQRILRIDYIYTEVLLNLLAVDGIPTLRGLLNERTAELFCSTEELEPIPDVLDAKRVQTRILLGDEYDIEVRLEFSTEHIASTTLGFLLKRGGHISLVAEILEEKDQLIVFAPLVMGYPKLFATAEIPEMTAMTNGFTLFEVLPEDVDEFTRMTEVALPDSPDAMAETSEKAFKTCLAEILGDKSQKDWGGERSDYFAAHMHLNGKRISGAFLLKGPARFAPMTLDHLGKRNDQIFRLSQEPADLLVVQHSHDIGPEVRATLSAFAVQPGHPRHYTLLDGRDSLRLLRAYDLYNRALELSRS
jgi:hypothetical protein